MSANMCFTCGKNPRSLAVSYKGEYRAPVNCDDCAARVAVARHQSAGATTRPPRAQVRPAWAAGRA